MYSKLKYQCKWLIETSKWNLFIVVFQLQENTLRGTSKLASFEGAQLVTAARKISANYIAVELLHNDNKKWIAYLVNITTITVDKHWKCQRPVT